MASTSEDKTIVTLRSSDGELFQVPQVVASQSMTVNHLIQDGCASSVIPISKVTGKTLSMVIEYCKKHAAGAEDDDALKSWDAEFMAVDQSVLLDLMMAANFLEIKGLLDLTCGMFADMIKDKTPEEIRKIFGIQNDFTPEEEEEVRMEAPWAFE